MRIGISGAPSSGKTSLTNELKNRNFTIIREAATQILEIRLLSGENLEDIFNDEVFQNQISLLNIHNFEDFGNNTLVFFDNTIVDNIAQRQVKNVNTLEIYEHSKKYRYDRIYYMEHPGKVEYNGVRLENIDEVMKLDKLKIQAIKDCGYELVIVPTFLNGEPNKKNINVAIKKRADYIINDLRKVFDINL